MVFSTFNEELIAYMPIKHYVKNKKYNSGKKRVHVLELSNYEYLVSQQAIKDGLPVFILRPMADYGLLYRTTFIDIMKIVLNIFSDISTDKEILWAEMPTLVAKECQKGIDDYIEILPLIYLTKKGSKSEITEHDIEGLYVEREVLYETLSSKYAFRAVLESVTINTIHNHLKIYDDKDEFIKGGILEHYKKLWADYEEAYPVEQEALVFIFKFSPIGSKDERAIEADSKAEH